jgi:hypothetical protein
MLKFGDGKYFILKTPELPVMVINIQIIRVHVPINFYSPRKINRRK